jgi:hypothetical protein
MRRFRGRLLTCGLHLTRSGPGWTRSNTAYNKPIAGTKPYAVRQRRNRQRRNRRRGRMIQTRTASPGCPLCQNQPTRPDPDLDPAGRPCPPFIAAADGAGGNDSPCIFEGGHALDLNGICCLHEWVFSVLRVVATATYLQPASMFWMVPRVCS